MPLVFGRNYPVAPRIGGLARYFHPGGEVTSSPAPAEVGTATGRPNGGHLFYAVNSARWWLLWVSAADDTLLRSAWSTDLTTWTFAETTHLTLGVSGGYNLAVAYKDISGNDVVHVGYGVRISATVHRSYHLRAQVAADVISYSADALVTPATTGDDGGTLFTDALSVVIGDDNRIYHLSSYVDTGANTGNGTTARSSNVDAGTSWTPGFDAPTTHELAVQWVWSSAGFDLGAGDVIAIYDNGAAITTWTDLRWTKYTGSWSAPANVFGSASTQTANDWGAVARTIGDIHVVRRLTATTYEHRRFDGTSWSAGQAIPGQANKTGAGLFLGSDGTDVWLFAVDSDSANTVRYVKWTGSVPSWGTWTAFETSTQVRTALSGAEAVGADGNAGVSWTEVNPDGGFRIVTEPLVLVAPATNADAEVAVGAGTAGDATVAVTVTTDATEVTGTAYDAAVAVAPDAEASTVAGTAQDPATSVASALSTATATGTAQDSSASITTDAGDASAAGTAYDATVAVAGEGLAEIALAGTGTFTERTAETSTAVPFPASVASGHVAVLKGSVFNLNQVTSLGGAWTDVAQFSATGNTATPDIYVALKVTDGTEGGTSVTVTHNNNVSAWQILVYSGVDTANPQDVAATAWDSTGDPVFPAQTIVTSGAAQDYSATNATTTNTATPPSGFTETGDLSSGTRPFTSGYKLGLATGSSGTVTVDFSGTGRSIGVLLALRPAVTATNAPAENTTATGSAGAATASVAPNAETSTAAGVAQDAATSVASTPSTGAATGTAHDAAVAVAVEGLADIATGVGTAYDAAITTTASADIAVAVGTALDPAASLGANAGLVSAAGAAFDATVVTGVSADAEVASGSGAAHDANVQVDISAEAASGTAEARDPVAAVTGTAEAAEATGAAYDATATSAVSATAEDAAGTGTAYAAVSHIDVASEMAIGAGTADDPTLAITVDAEATASTGTAYAATVSTDTATNAPAEAASATGSAEDAQSEVSASGEAAEALGATQDATADIQTSAGDATGASGTFNASIAVSVTAESASATGTAYDATVATSTSTDALAECATADGEALDAIAALALAVEAAFATSTAYNATVLTSAPAPGAGTADHTPHATADHPHWSTFTPISTGSADHANRSRAEVTV
jgi:hypothetical protein